MNTAYLYNTEHPQKQMSGRVIIGVRRGRGRPPRREREDDEVQYDELLVPQRFVSVQEFKLWWDEWEAFDGRMAMAMSRLQISETSVLQDVRRHIRHSMSLDYSTNLHNEKELLWVAEWITPSLVARARLRKLKLPATMYPTADLDMHPT